ncbi:MAG: AAA family ATPase [Verrucomicrobia bacterium]|nr:AAA family ATPase [Verrucomicrobiota bacterium]
MKSYQVTENENFVGREPEQNQLHEISTKQGSKILIVYGRRRVGKTELLEQTFCDRYLLKFEGRENLPQHDQMKFVMRQLAEYADEPLLSRVAVDDWVEVLKEIAKRTQDGVWTVYFEEVQWLADYKTDFVTALKYVWDNFFRHNKEMLIILCGSSPSFMINSVVKSKALYNRSQYEIPLKELNVLEAKEMLPTCSLQEVFDAYLTVGGLPEYLKRLNTRQSVYLTLCKESFLPGAFFASEYEKIFTSSLSSNKHYKQIIAYLSNQRFASRNEITGHLQLRSGGALSSELSDLELCGFIDHYSPYQLSSRSHLVRYCIVDAYMQFYFRFIEPNLKAISNGDFRSNPLHALNMSAYQQWLGYSFERFCRKFHRQVATLLGFQAVKYRVGPYFSRKTSVEEPGFQIDLLFDRDDKVMTICEIKYSQTPTSSKVIDEFEKKLQALPNTDKKTIQRVLISNLGMDASLERRAYFDASIRVDDFFKPHIWM